MANKPIELELFEAKKELAEAINNVSAKHHLSAYFLNDMLDGIHNEVRRVAQEQLGQMARQAEIDRAKEAAQEEANAREATDVAGEN